jgi:hypothetical protein
MVGNRYSGDDIAADFFSLIKSNAPQVKKPETRASGIVITAEANEPEAEEVSAKDFLMKTNNGESNDAIDELENQIDDFGRVDELATVSSDSDDVMVSEAASLGPDKRTLRILSGLGKIAGGLRRKGEGFAADVVEATAMSVRDESLAEVRKKAFVLSELKKISRELRGDNNIFASDLVSATANKILKY